MDGSVSRCVPLTPQDEALVTNFAATRGLSRDAVLRAFHIIREQLALDRPPELILGHLVTVQRQVGQQRRASSLVAWRGEGAGPWRWGAQDRALDPVELQGALEAAVQAFEEAHHA